MLQVFIQDNFSQGKTEIYVKSERNSKEYFYHQEKSGEPWTEVEIENQGVVDSIKPLLSVPHRMREDFLKAFIKAASDVGVKPESESHLEGKLKATELHLTDMRNLTNMLTKELITRENFVES